MMDRSESFKPSNVRFKAFAIPGSNWKLMPAKMMSLIRNVFGVRSLHWDKEAVAYR